MNIGSRQYLRFYCLYFYGTFPLSCVPLEWASVMTNILQIPHVPDWVYRFKFPVGTGVRRRIPVHLFKGDRRFKLVFVLPRVLLNEGSRLT